MKTRVVTTHIPVELAEQVDELATRLERPKGWIVRQALAAWVALDANRHQLTLEGLADVDAGCVVDQSAIESWANGLDEPA